MIEIAGYNIYPAFWVLLILGISVIVGSVVCTRKYKIAKKEKVCAKITQTQRNLLTKIMELEKEDYLSKDGTAKKDPFIKQTNMFLKYLKKEKKWKINDLLSIDASFICRISKILFNWAIECEKRDQTEKMCLLLFTIDAINGGASFENGDMVWLTEDIPEIQISSDKSSIIHIGSKKEPVYDERLLGLSDQIVSDFQDGEFVDDVNVYQNFIKGFPLLESYSSDDIDALKDKIMELDAPIFVLPKEDKKLLCFISLFSVNQLWNEMTTNTISEYRRCYLRAAVSYIQSMAYDKYTYTKIGG